MSDETEMNPELETFAANLRNTPTPEANIDRDQLMYDAGWAAAMTNRERKVGVTGRTGGLMKLAMSFAGGVATAAAVLLSVVPSSTETNGSAIGHNGIASIEIKSVKEPERTVNPIADSNSEEIDLLAWIENLPPGQSINSGFSSSPTNPALANLELSSQRSFDRRAYRPKTSGQLLSELMPGVATRPVTPAWSAWLIP